MTDSKPRTTIETVTFLKPYRVLADNYDLLVFDLDGTLVDSLEDLAESVNHVLSTMSRPPLSLGVVRSYVGDGVGKLISRSLGDGVAPSELTAGLGTFVEHYEANCLRHTTPYPGVSEALKALAGKSLAVLTNKPEAMTERILDGLELRGYFGEVVGADGAPAKKPDPRGLLGLVERAGVAPERTLLVGDTGIDVQTARASAIHVAGVAYGFRPEELEESPPDYVLESLMQLLGPPETVRYDRQERDR